MQLFPLVLTTVTLFSRANNLRRLQMVQNRASRLVLGVGRMTSPEPLLRQLHWLPVAKRIQYKTALITFKTLFSAQPSYLFALLLPYQPSRSLRSSSSYFLTVPRVHTTLESHAFSVAAPRLWNSLPISLRTLSSSSFLIPHPSDCNSLSSSLLPSPSLPHLSPNLPTFKSLLKTHLFDSPASSAS